MSLATSRSSKKAFFTFSVFVHVLAKRGEHYFRKTSLLTQSRVNFAEMWNSIISSNSQKLWENVSNLTQTCYFLQGLSDVKKLQKSFFFHIFCVCPCSSQAGRAQNTSKAWIWNLLEFDSKSRLKSFNIADFNIKNWGFVII